MDNRTIEQIRENETRWINKADELSNINEKLSLALESTEKRIDKAISYINGTKKDPDDLTDYSLGLINILEGYDE